MWRTYEERRERSLSADIVYYYCCRDGILKRNAAVEKQSRFVALWRSHHDANHHTWPDWVLNRSHAWFHFDFVHLLVCIECTWWQAAMFASPKFKKVENRIKNYLFQLQFWYSLLTIRSIPHHTSKSEIYLLISYFFGDKNQIIKSYIPPKNELNSGLSSIFFIFHSVIKFHYSSRSFLSIFPFLFYY